MRLENLLALTHGVLVNEPCVSSFESIIFEAHRVKRGDLFFAYNADDIEVAVNNGAYGIVFDKSAEVNDSEIAWIKVDDLDEAIKRLLRFRLIEKEVVAYECNEIVLKLALQVITQNSFLVVFGDMRSVFKSLWQVEERTTILFCPALNSKDIFTNIRVLTKNTRESIQIMEQTLFETSFIYDNIFYERQLISPFFIPYLEELLHLYKSLKVDFRLRKFTPIEHFQAVFTNKNFEIKEFGTSDKVLIFEQNTNIIESEIKFLHSNAPWAKIIFIILDSLEISQDESIFKYKHQNEILSILEQNNFHFALIVGVDKSILEKKTPYHTQLTLF